MGSKNRSRVEGIRYFLPAIFCYKKKSSLQGTWVVPISLNSVCSLELHVNLLYEFIHAHMHAPRFSRSSSAMAKRTLRFQRNQRWLCHTVSVEKHFICSCINLIWQNLKSYFRLWQVMKQNRKGIIRYQRVTCGYTKLWLFSQVKKLAWENSPWILSSLKLGGQIIQLFIFLFY